jgi:hypothetical protein
MYVAILDTNVLLGLTPAQFSLLVTRETERGVQQYADLWTIMELIAHLGVPTGPRYWPSRTALRRCVERALLPVDRSPRVVAPSELQVSRLIFGKASRAQEQNVDAHIELAQSIALADDADDLAAFHNGIQTVAQHIEEKERWFVEYFEGMRRQIIEATKAKTKGERNAEVRAFTRSETAMRADAAALVVRAYEQTGRTVPDDIPEALIDRVLPASRPSSCATGVLMERIICDDAGLEKSSIRNLLWDQEVAGNVAQSINGLPVLLVTGDKYFTEAAGRIGYAQGVCKPEEYLTKLGDAA